MRSPAQPARPGPGTERGERTRQLIVDTAMDLFAAQGYERTTMRTIAERAGVSVGNAYYYYPSKQHLVQEFYQRIQQRHRSAAAGVLGRETAFAPRLAGTLHAGLDVMGPYHGFAGAFISTAIVPDSPLSPFSAESAPARDAGTALFRQVVEGTQDRMDTQVRAELPGLLWLAHLGLTVYWVHDTSPDTRRTRDLVDAAVPLADRLVRMSRLPMLRSTLHDVLALVATATGQPPA